MQTWFTILINSRKSTTSALNKLTTTKSRSPNSNKTSLKSKDPPAQSQPKVLAVESSPGKDLTKRGTSPILTWASNVKAKYISKNAKFLRANLVAGHHPVGTGRWFCVVIGRRIRDFLIWQRSWIQRSIRYRNKRRWLRSWMKGCWRIRLRSEGRKDCHVCQ